MARLKKGALPTYRLHKATGKAVVTLDGKYRYCGPCDLPEGKAKCTHG